MIYPTWYYIILGVLAALLVAWVAVGVKILIFSRRGKK